MASSRSTGLSALSAAILFTTLLPSLLQPVTAQQTILDFSSGALPACAQQCTLLQQAQGACIGSSAGLKSCFCLSGYLTTLYQSPNGICDAFCTSAADNQQIRTWYLGVCSATGTVGVGAAAPSTAPAVTVTEGAPTATAAATATPTSGAVGTNRASKGSWWSNHWQWILMLILIIIGLVLLAFLLTWLKRRHNRKQEQRAREKAGGEGVIWGPIHDQHSTAQFSYPDTSSVRGNRWSGVSVADTDLISTAGRDDTPAVPPLPVGEKRKGKRRVRDQGHSVDAQIMTEKDLERGAGKKLSKRVDGQ